METEPKQGQNKEGLTLEQKREQFRKNLEVALGGKKITGVEIKEDSIYLHCEGDKGIQIEIHQLDPDDIPEMIVNGVSLKDFNARREGYF